MPGDKTIYLIEYTVTQNALPSINAAQPKNANTADEFRMECDHMKRTLGPVMAEYESLEEQKWLDSQPDLQSVDPGLISRLRETHRAQAYIEDHWFEIPFCYLALNINSPLTFFTEDQPAIQKMWTDEKYYPSAH